MKSHLIVLLLLAITLSLVQRVFEKKRSEKQELPEHVKKSPFSEALQELIATAGGIYLSLVLLVSFLQIDLAEEWFVFDVGMDPLAFISLLISVVQPFFVKLSRLIKGGV